MKTVLITGASGFIGKNLAARLRQEPDVRIVEFTRKNSLDELASLVQESDFIFHLAAVMRPTDERDFHTINTELTEHITNSIKASGKSIPLLLTSSIQAELDNPYGKSKVAAEKVVLDLGKSSHNEVYVYRLTNVFGKWAKPNSSSVVATFCYNVSHDLPINIHDPKTRLNLVYIDDVVEEFVKTLRGDPLLEKDGFYYIPRVFTVTLGELAEKIHAISRHTRANEAPQFDDLFDKFLYTTYMSYATA